MSLLALLVSIIMSLLALLVSIIMSLLGTAGQVPPAANPAPTPAPYTATQTPLTPYTACISEDSPGPCYWNAAQRGNGTGTSFIVNADQSVTYVTQEQLDTFIYNISHPPTIETHTPEYMSEHSIEGK